MMIALLAEHASMNVRLKQYQKETSTKSILMSALTAVLVQMFARSRQSTRHSPDREKIPEKVISF